MPAPGLLSLYGVTRCWYTAATCPGSTTSTPTTAGACSTRAMPPPRPRTSGGLSSGRAPSPRDLGVHALRAQPSLRARARGLARHGRGRHAATRGRKGRCRAEAPKAPHAPRPNSSPASATSCARPQRHHRFRPLAQDASRRHLDAEQHRRLGIIEGLRLPVAQPSLTRSSTFPASRPGGSSCPCPFLLLRPLLERLWRCSNG